METDAPKLSAKLKHMLVTPEMAKAWLNKTSQTTRVLSQPHVGLLAGVLWEGHWERSRENIILTASGQVLDGQHRLQAIVESGVAAYSLVAIGEGA